MHCSRVGGMSALGFRCSLVAFLPIGVSYDWLANISQSCLAVKRMLGQMHRWVLHGELKVDQDNRGCWSIPLQLCTSAEPSPVLNLQNLQHRWIFQGPLAWKNHFLSEACPECLHLSQLPQSLPSSSVYTVSHVGQPLSASCAAMKYGIDYWFVCNVYRRSPSGTLPLLVSDTPCAFPIIPGHRWCSKDDVKQMCGFLIAFCNVWRSCTVITLTREMAALNI